MIFEMEYDGSYGNHGCFMSVDDAETIESAFISGFPVILHFPVEVGSVAFDCIGNEAYLKVLAWQPAFEIGESLNYIGNDGSSVELGFVLTINNSGANNGNQNQSKIENLYETVITNDRKIRIVLSNNNDEISV